MGAREPLKFGDFGHICPPRKVSFRQLFRYFPKAFPELRREGVAAPPSLIADSSETTHRGKHPWHNSFFREKRSEIKTFADVGCALTQGAPTTVEAREILPRKTRVLAIDMIGDFDDPALRSQGIEPLKHSILKGPLPQTVDAIRLAGVTPYLTGSERRRALVNSHASLNEGGFLMGNHHIYRKSGRGFELIAEKPISRV